MARTYPFNWTPGNYIPFRVRAQRRSITSNPSTPVTLWDGSSTEFLSVAA